MSKTLNYVAIALVRMYKKTLSPQTGALRFIYYSPLITFTPGSTGCKFEKTCSTFAIEQYKEHPFKEATQNSLKRIASCHR